MNKLFLIIFGLYLVASQPAVLQKVLLKDPGALCLDGTPGAYYVLKGKAPQKIILNFQGGGWCGADNLEATIQDCYYRSKTSLGSSKHYPDTITYSEGILSNSIKNQLNEATKIRLKYCDGSGYQGSRAEPLIHKGQNLYFRGHNITVAQLDDIERTLGLFSKAKDIIIVGQSAGGLATFLWTNYIKERAKTQNVFSIPDSGIFLDSPVFNTQVHSYMNGFINLFKISNVQIDPPVPQCIAANKNQRQKCMFAQQLYKYIKVPLFPIQSLIDSWSIPNILKINCINDCSESQRKYIEEYKQNTTIVLQKIGSLSQRNGYWATSSYSHTFVGYYIFNSKEYTIPKNSQFSLEDALISWLKDQKVSHKHINQPLPSNKPRPCIKEQNIKYQQLFKDLIKIYLN